MPTAINSSINVNPPDLFMRSFLLLGDLKTTHPDCDMPSVSDERSD